MNRWWHGDAACVSVLAIALVLFVVAVYCPDLGRGFVKDDFTWFARHRARSRTHPSARRRILSPNIVSAAETWQPERVPTRPIGRLCR